jgi:hypothetical protein
MVRRALAEVEHMGGFSSTGAKVQTRAITSLTPVETPSTDVLESFVVPELVMKYRRGYPVDPPVVNAAGVILDGHHRVASALAAGRANIFVVVVRGNKLKGAPGFSWFEGRT